MKTVEILQYTLKSGTGHRFHQIMVEESSPLHRAAGMDIVAFGNSLHDSDSYYLIRAYDSLEHLESSQNSFYHSDVWRNGPRLSIIESIETSVKSVLILSENAVDSLRS
jgi:hypothetical protein